MERRYTVLHDGNVYDKKKKKMYVGGAALLMGDMLNEVYEPKETLIDKIKRVLGL